MQKYNIQSVFDEIDTFRGNCFLRVLQLRVLLPTFRLSWFFELTRDNLFEQANMTQVLSMTLDLSESLSVTQQRFCAGVSAKKVCCGAPGCTLIRGSTTCSPKHLELYTSYLRYPSMASLLPTVFSTWQASLLEW